MARFERGGQHSGERHGGRFDRGGGFGGRFGGGDFTPREMHKATCSDCGVECEVPFKPTEGKPVFCKECYRKRKPRF